MWEVTRAINRLKSIIGQLVGSASLWFRSSDRRSNYCCVKAWSRSCELNLWQANQTNLIKTIRKLSFDPLISKCCNAGKKWNKAKVLSASSHTHPPLNDNDSWRTSQYHDSHYCSMLQVVNFPIFTSGFIVFLGSTAHVVLLWWFDFRFSFSSVGNSGCANFLFNRLFVTDNRVATILFVHF